MSFRYHKSFFLPQELEVLQRVYDRACLFLALNREDAEGRNRLAVVMFEIARGDLGSETELLHRAVRVCCQHASAAPVRKGPPGISAA